MNYEITVENIKCGGCANTIKTRVEQTDSVNSVEVDVEAGIVRIDGDAGTREAVVTRLAQLGYPEAGSVEGLKAATAKAKSFVSCTIGRVEGRKD